MPRMNQAIVLEPPDWRAAACKSADPELFFPASPRQTAAAKRICGSCPVRDACLGWALDNAREGIWGGMTEDERNKLRRLRRIGTGVY